MAQALAGVMEEHRQEVAKVEELRVQDEARRLEREAARVAETADEWRETLLEQQVSTEESALRRRRPRLVHYHTPCTFPQCAARPVHRV